MGAEMTVRPGKSGRSGKSGRPGRSGKSEKFEKSERSGTFKQKRVLYGLILILAVSVSIYAEKSFKSPSVTEQPSLSGGESGRAGATFEEGRSAVYDWYESIPAYAGKASVPVHGNIPFFTAEEITEEVFEEYSDLDEMGRCGTAFANICREIMPTEEREPIGNVRPTGWQTVKYDVITDQYLYNRCHLIGYQLAGENANEKNLITGTRYMNVEGMLPWEDLVADYVRKSGNHVLYRVTPCFEGNNLVASGVLMEAYSVEDDGQGICFNVYCYNLQPGVIIVYETGESSRDENWSLEEQKNTAYDYVLNVNTKKFHMPSCESVDDMDEKNREYFTGGRRELIEKGYEPCSRCHP